jgi:hypothetical protein
MCTEEEHLKYYVCQKAYAVISQFLRCPGERAFRYDIQREMFSWNEYLKNSIHTHMGEQCLKEASKYLWIIEASSNMFICMEGS